MVLGHFLLMIPSDLLLITFVAITSFCLSALCGYPSGDEGASSRILLMEPAHGFLILELFLELITFYLLDFLFCSLQPVFLQQKVVISPQSL